MKEKLIRFYPLPILMNIRYNKTMELILAKNFASSLALAGAVFILNQEGQKAQRVV